MTVFRILFIVENDLVPYYKIQSSLLFGEELAILANEDDISGSNQEYYAKEITKMARRHKMGGWMRTTVYAAFGDQGCS